LSFRRFNNDKIRKIPRKWRLPATLVLTAVTLDAGRGGGVAAVVGPTVPGKDDGQFGCPGLQRIEATDSSAADDDFDSAFLRTRRGSTTRGSGCFRRHGSNFLSA
jgi:hypothetical protein